MASNRSRIAVRQKIFALFVGTVLLFLALFVRLGYVQFVLGSDLQQKAAEARMRDVPVAAARGTIYDRNGKKLAVSLSADSVYASPPDVQRAGKEEETADFLSQVLGMSKEGIMEKLKSSTGFQWIKRKADFDVAEKVRAADLPGIDIVEETMRFYPKNELAAHILGFAGIDNQGLEGIELTEDDILAGVPGSIVTQYDAKGQEIPQAVQQYIAPEDGNSLVLTIDETIQYFAERELDKLMAQENPPKGATILIMKPSTGEIIAMANRPTYDPNSYADYETIDLRNKAVTDVYEPGSTFKMFTASAALESGTSTINDRFYDPGYIMVGKIKIHCWRATPHGSESFAEILQNSCNPGFVAVGLKMADKDMGLFYKYIRAFGFGKSTGISLPGESSGILINEDKLTRLNIANIAIGQSIAVTPLQMVTGACAIANGGILMEPQIVRQVLDKDGNVVQDFAPKEVGRVISEKTSETMRTLLEGVVSKGTGKNAYIEGYRVGGKTGTAQKAGEGGYMPGKYVASFLGMAPANDPQLVMLIAIDEPQGYPYQGGQIAAPVFKAVMEDALCYLGVKAQIPGEDEDKIQQTQEGTAKTVSVPDVTGLSKDDAEKILHIAGLSTGVSGSGEVVASQSPAAFSRLPSGGKVTIKLQKGTPDKEHVVVPDLTGMRVREAAEILNAMDLRLKTSGAGLVASQTPIPGSVVAPQDIIEVVLSPEDESAETTVTGP